MNHNLILVAEDDEDIRDMLVSTLRQADFLTVQAKDGNTAARIVTMAQPIGIVTDVRMPALNGMELCRMVRSNPELRDTVVLMTSAHTDPSDIEMGLRAGADDYLPKPLSPKQIIRNLRHLIQERGNQTPPTPWADLVTSTADRTSGRDHDQKVTARRRHH